MEYACTDLEQDATASMLSSMKGIKMSGLTQTLSTVIQNLRVEEIKFASKFRTLQIALITLGKYPCTTNYAWESVRLTFH
jgi:ATP-binding cassette, subfamily C (CFTR/MRP), member 1